MHERAQTMTRRHLFAELESAKTRLAEAEEVLRAIRRGEADALVDTPRDAMRVVALEGEASAYRALVEAMNEGAGILRSETTLVYANARLASMLRTPLEAVIGASLDAFVVPTEREAFARLLKRGRTRTCAGEVTVAAADGTAVPVQLSLAPMVVDGEPQVSVVATDLTDRKRAEEELRCLSLVDDLTGLNNRRGFFTLATQHLRLAGRLRGHLFVAFADLDGLKDINDSLGHAAGDHALTDAAAVLRHTFRDSDVIGRLGGDEFAVLGVGVGAFDAGALDHRLVQAIAIHNATARRPYALGISAGFVAYDPASATTLDDLLARADAVMYERRRLEREARPDHSERSVRV